MSEGEQAWVSISSGDLAVQIDPQGAQLSVMRDRTGRDLLWDGQPAVWAGRAPILFPIVGTLVGGRYRLASRSYALPRHGFARGRRFDLLEATAATATFGLRADESTRAVYPFEFELDVRFALDGPVLTVTTWIRNAGGVDMPASFGYHPALRWPLPFGRPREAHYIEFERDEPAAVRRLGTDGLLAPERHPTPVAHRRLALADELFRDDVVIFDEVRSRFVTYGADAGPKVRITYPESPYLGLWTKPHADFICIEPWRGLSDPRGFSGDFTAKPGIFMVAPGAVRPIVMAITLLEP